MKIGWENFSDIEQDYVYEYSIFEESVMMKRAINKLNKRDFNIIVLYAELQSLRKVAKILNISHQTIKREVDRIRKEIKCYL